MVRTQIQLTEAQVSALQSMAASRQVSIAKLIRAAVDALVEREAGESREELAARAKRTFGRFDSGLSDVSRDHDKYLAEAYSEHS